ncbi:MAG: DUF1405 domain-containing protein [Haloarculaceae archaeon]
MASPSSAVRDAAARVVALGGEVPEREDLPWYVAPLPAWIEDVGLSLAWLVVAINLAGTAFGFYYYGFQFTVEPVVMWPFVPDSPVATLFIALSIAAWKLGHEQEWLNALAFFGCLKLGVWTPFVLLVFFDHWSYLHPAMYNFLLWSHLAMAVEGFVLYRYADFPVGAVFVAVLWYGANDVVDYFVPIVGTPHHTLLPVQSIVGGVPQHVSPAHEIAAAGAVVLTVLATFLALATRVKKLERRLRADG